MTGEKTLSMLLLAAVLAVSALAGAAEADNCDRGPFFRGFWSGPRFGGFWSGPGHQAFTKQLSWLGTGPVLSVQGYLITSRGEAERLRVVWAEMAELMRRKPGFIVADLSPGAGKSRLWIEISKWESTAHLRAAFNDPQVQATAQKLPEIGMSHIFVASKGGHADPATDAIR